MFALGRHAGPRRQAVVALKERGRSDLTAPLAHALALGLHRLLNWGILDTPLTVVPAPTRRLAARRRGGDPVTRLAVRATGAHPGIGVAPVLRFRAGVRDSVGLDSAARERNTAGRIRSTTPVAGDVLLWQHEPGVSVFVFFVALMRSTSASTWPRLRSASGSAWSGARTWVAASIARVIFSPAAAPIAPPQKRKSMTATATLMP